MVAVKKKSDEKEKLWNTLFDYTKQNYPICCTTGDEDAKNGLSPGHSYTLVFVS
jgi:hypothetical protein